jgi:hypothetical protein
MKLRITFTCLKRNFDDWIKALDFQCAKVRRRIKRQAIQAGCQITFQKQLRTPAVSVGACRAEHAPIAGRFLSLESDWHIARWPAAH